MHVDIEDEELFQIYFLASIRSPSRPHTKTYLGIQFMIKITNTGRVHKPPDQV